MTLNSKFVSLKFSDSHGNLKHKLVRKEAVTRRTNIYMDGSSLGLCDVTQSAVSLVPDWDTEHFDPILNIDSIFCNVCINPGDVSDLCNRQYAQHMDESFSNKKSLWGVEPEFFILPKKWQHHMDFQDRLPENTAYADVICYNDEQINIIVADIVSHLEKTEPFIKVQSMHSEVADYQFEISWQPADLVGTCDRMLFFKYVVDTVSRQYNYVANFTPKPFDNVNGNGCHTHQSMPAFQDDYNEVVKYAENLCNAVRLADKAFEAERKNEDFRHRDKDIISLCNPHKDSYKRTVGDFEAPSIKDARFAVEDRTALVRIPSARNRVEFRLPDPTMNPYLALPVMLKCGLLGKNQ
jgi:glutamine synthetase